MSEKSVLNQLLASISNFSERNAFCINEMFYTYNELAKCISKIRKKLQSLHIQTKNVGLIANDDLETYASIYAIWFEGFAYVPLHPLQPVERNKEIIFQADIANVLASDDTYPLLGVNIIETNKLIFEEYLLDLNDIPESSLAYILFTSGSTGKPKGVPITHGNLYAFVESFFDLGYTINENDKFLQQFDLTFDLSIISYLIPGLKGSCVYTIPYEQIKFMYIAELLDDHSLTFALMVPSMLQCLRPYFKGLRLMDLKYSLFCGEALPLGLTEEWSKCIPNAVIDNMYGPTEDTIFSSQYRFKSNDENKTHNGILSIGKSMSSGEMIIIDDENKEVDCDIQGELCLAGNQLTPGYWKNPSKNEEAFLLINNQRFYRTGDICFKDKDGDIFYCGRLDHQVKVQGFRIELGEIEHHVREYLSGPNAVCVALNDANGNTEIGLFIELSEYNAEGLVEYLRSKLPPYMIPVKIISYPQFPLNVNGKIDRLALKQLV